MMKTEKGYRSKKSYILLTFNYKFNKKVKNEIEKDWEERLKK